MKQLPVLIAALLLFTACTHYPQADEVVIGKIWTGNDNQPWAEAMAIAADTILAVGMRSNVLKYAGKIHASLR